MSDAIDALRSTVSHLESLVYKYPWLIINESELQAYLQALLLERLKETPPVTLAPNLNNRRSGYSFSCRRVYRELKVEEGRSGKETDIIVLTNDKQTILPKANQAPARFLPPYDIIIETKVDASSAQIINRKASSSLSAKVIKQDIAKWQQKKGLANNILSIVYTATPEKYYNLSNVITIRRTIADQPPLLPDKNNSLLAAKSYDKAVKNLYQKFARQPLWYIREKDFESELLYSMQKNLTLHPERLSPVRTQWYSEHKDLLKKNRRHDLVVLSDVQGHLLLEVELKTSHSDSHNWFRKKDVDKEYDSINTLVNNKLLSRGVFAMFRYGEKRWIEDTINLNQKYPRVELNYFCSEMD